MIRSILFVVVLLFTTQVCNAQHWSYPGTINNHLTRDHRVSTVGLSREQMLNLHDSLHRQGTPVRSFVSSAPVRKVFARRPARSFLRRFR